MEGILGKHSKEISWFLFILGFIGALGLRLVIILHHYDESYAALAWYIAIIAYTIFFYYRLIIENKRREIILKSGLRQRIRNSSLANKDKKILVTLLNSITVSLVRINYIIIIVLSILAMLADIAIRLLK